MNATQVKSADTRFPKLTRSMILQTGRANLAEIAFHAADSGWAGLTWRADTTSFFRRNRHQILEMAGQLADDMGIGMFEVIRGFGCLKNENLTDTAIYKALNSRGEYAITIQNALTWFAAEEVARELNPEA